jgi:hypothetical protein
MTMLLLAPFAAFGLADLVLFLVVCLSDGG